ncbi:formin-2-like isoform X2 [Electrophorus electricus]|nr:formin-2-like isoform X2 [Electrophorus electricus]XP_026858092.2 formin-2-like isoform X2 [Electrophorus electricus]XP_026858093.2 formin-2-like isoform X2 [Electrophorus electricus]XP_026858094.2 formin-2-like isoform X2 [Electrophorus electricus]XP_026858095.2 formin-2-like isoform X2 [Electrophorus electricus]XP_035385168.1 formin-2-like isoform X2 [Electrophorus electricus]XP_035385169.1 formin-2-like isoform X2 [Electrophorus electricus]
MPLEIAPAPGMEDAPPSGESILVTGIEGTIQPIPEAAARGKTVALKATQLASQSATVFLPCSNPIPVAVSMSTSISMPTPAAAAPLDLQPISLPGLENSSLPVSVPITEDATMPVPVPGIVDTIQPVPVPVPPDPRMKLMGQPPDPTAVPPVLPDPPPAAALLPDLSDSPTAAMPLDLPYPLPAAAMPPYLPDIPLAVMLFSLRFLLGYTIPVSIRKYCRVFALASYVCL